MIKNYEQYINEDLRSKNISLFDDYHLTQLYPDIQVRSNDSKIIISYDKLLTLNEQFYKAISDDGITLENVWFEDCSDISLDNVTNFTTVSNYGTFGKNIKNFTCAHCSNLTSLEGAPPSANVFDCSYCENLESFQGAPKVVTKFDCSWCANVKSLKHCHQNG